MIYLALYKGQRDGAWYQPSVLSARLSDWAIRTFTRGKYSHCEIALALNRSDGYTCYSSSIRDGGVRCKTMPLPPEKWDLIPLGNSDKLQQRLHTLYQSEQGKAYDWAGALGIVLPTRQHGDKWFCSEFCAAIIGLPEPARYSPNDLARLASQNTGFSQYETPLQNV